MPDGSAGVLTGPVVDVGTIGAIDVGETWTYTISYLVSQSEVDAGLDLINTVSVVTSEVPGPTEDTETTPVDQSPSLTVTKTQTGGPSPVTMSGDVIDYTIVVVNTGNVSLAGIVASDLLPDGSAGVLTGPVADIGTIGAIDVGETWTYTISYTVSQSDIDAGLDLINTVSVVASEVPGPTEDTETTPVDQSPSLTISKDTNWRTVASNDVR